MFQPLPLHLHHMPLFPLRRNTNSRRRPRTDSNNASNTQAAAVAAPAATAVDSSHNNSNNHLADSQFSGTSNDLIMPTTTTTSSSSFYSATLSLKSAPTGSFGRTNVVEKKDDEYLNIDAPVLVTKLHFERSQYTAVREGRLDKSSTPSSSRDTAAHKDDALPYSGSRTDMDLPPTPPSSSQPSGTSFRSDTRTNMDESIRAQQQALHTYQRQQPRDNVLANTHVSTKSSTSTSHSTVQHQRTWLDREDSSAELLLNPNTTSLRLDREDLSVAAATEPSSNNPMHAGSLTQVEPSLGDIDQKRLARFVASQERALVEFEQARSKQQGDKSGQRRDSIHSSDSSSAFSFDENNIYALANQMSSVGARPRVEDDCGVAQPTLPTRGSNVVCQCCFETVSGMTVSCCSDGVGDDATQQKRPACDQFCKRCITRYVDSFCYGESYPLLTDPRNESFNVLPCLAPSCKGGYFKHDAIQNTCTQTSWEAYQEKVFRMFLVTGKASMNFVVEEEDDAIGQTDATLAEQQHNQIAEAMTRSKLRRCPNCHTPFLKEDGYCNKIKCPSCRTAICYLCRKQVPHKGYDHFCVHAYDVCPRNCGKCVLWTTKDEDADAAEMRRVAHNTANEMWEKSLLSGEGTEAAQSMATAERLLEDDRGS